MSYAQLPELKTYLTITDADRIDDNMLSDALVAAEELIDGYCGRSFGVAGTASVDRVYAPSTCGFVSINDAVEVTAVATSTGVYGVYDDDWDAADWQGEPLNAVMNGRTWPTMTIRAVGSRRFTIGAGASVQVSARFGWESTPDAVRQATLIQAAKLFKRAGSPLGIAGGAETGLMRLVGSGVDVDAARLLLPYRKSPGVGVA